MLTLLHNNSLIDCFMIFRNVWIEKDKFGLLLHHWKTNSDMLSAALCREDKERVHWLILQDQTAQNPLYERSSAQLSYNLLNQLRLVIASGEVFWIQRSHSTFQVFFSGWLTRATTLQAVIQLTHYIRVACFAHMCLYQALDTISKCNRWHFMTLLEKFSLLFIPILHPTVFKF